MSDGLGIFGGFTRWAIVFLIIFVLFFLLVPYGYGGAGYGTPVCVGSGYGGTGYSPYGGTYGGLY